jgi:hypothetical protein
VWLYFVLFTEVLSVDVFPVCVFSVDVLFVEVLFTEVSGGYDAMQLWCTTLNL